MRSLYRQALGMAALLAATGPVRADELAESTPPAVLEERVKEFLEEFIDPDQTPEEQARFFVEGTEYYRFGPTSRRDIAADIKRYTRRWPTRSYRLLQIDYLTRDPATGDVFVSYIVEFDVANATAQAHGQASYGAGITDVHSAPKMVMIMERISSQGQ